MPLDVAPVCVAVGLVVVLDSGMPGGEVRGDGVGDVLPDDVVLRLGRPIPAGIPARALAEPPDVGMAGLWVERNNWLSAVSDCWPVYGLESKT